MALHVKYRKKLHGVMLKSGYLYTFKYRAWGEDPKPLLLFFYAINGINPNTGHQWRLIEGCNINYLPKSMRRAFANEWVRVFDRTGGNVRFTYKILQRRYPYMRFAVRRYLLKPRYYISKLKEIPFEDMEAAIVSTWSKEFSRKVKVSLLQKFRSSMKSRKKTKKKAKKAAKKYRFKI